MLTVEGHSHGRRLPNRTSHRTVSTREAADDSAADGQACVTTTYFPRIWVWMRRSTRLAPLTVFFEAGSLTAAVALQVKNDISADFASGGARCAAVNSGT